MTQGRTQRRDARSHRNEYEIASYHRVEIEAVTRDIEQLDLTTNAHVIDHGAGAHLLLHQHFEVPVFRRARKSKVSGLFTLHSQHRNLPGPEIDHSVSTKIE